MLRTALQLVFAVSLNSFQTNCQRHRPNGWMLGCCLVLTASIALGVFSPALLSPAQAAGCQHQTSPRLDSDWNRSDFNVPLNDEVEPSLLGKWQYAGGKIYYVFHPAPDRCDGPGCRQAPEPGTEMTVVPSSSDRLSSPACESAARQLFPTAGRFAWQVINEMGSSPALSGLLRPPCCA